MEQNQEVMFSRVFCVLLFFNRGNNNSMSFQCAREVCQVDLQKGNPWDVFALQAILAPDSGDKKRCWRCKVLNAQLPSAFHTASVPSLFGF